MNFVYPTNLYILFSCPFLIMSYSSSAFINLERAAAALFSISRPCRQLERPCGAALARSVSVKRIPLCPADRTKHYRCRYYYSRSVSSDSANPCGWNCQSNYLGLDQCIGMGGDTQGVSDTRRRAAALAVTWKRAASTELRKSSRNTGPDSE